MIRFVFVCCRLFAGLTRSGAVFFFFVPLMPSLVGSWFCVVLYRIFIGFGAVSIGLPPIPVLIDVPIWFHSPNILSIVFFCAGDGSSARLTGFCAGFLGLLFFFYSVMVGSTANGRHYNGAVNE